MRTKRINPYSNFAGLVEAILAFDHHRLEEGVVQCIILEGGRVITGSITQREPDLWLVRNEPGGREKVKYHLRLLLEERRGEFVASMNNCRPVLWQIST